MNITEHRLKQIIREEVDRNILINEEMTRLVEQAIAEGLTKEKVKSYLDKWKVSKEFQAKVKENFPEFGGMPNLKRIAAIVAIGVMGAGVADFGTRVTLDNAAASIESSLAASHSAAVKKHRPSSKQVSNFIDMAASEGKAPMPVNNPKQIRSVIDTYAQKGIEQAPLAVDNVLKMTTGEKILAYTPASEIPDEEVLPFVGLTKAEYTNVLRATVLAQNPDDPDKALRDFLGFSGKSGDTQRWAYGPEGVTFFYVMPNAPAGQRGLMMPPEWSVGYALLQKRLSTPNKWEKHPETP